MDGWLILYRVLPTLAPGVSTAPSHWVVYYTQQYKIADSRTTRTRPHPYLKIRAPPPLFTMDNTEGPQIGLGGRYTHWLLMVSSLGLLIIGVPHITRSTSPKTCLLPVHTGTTNVINL